MRVDQLDIMGILSALAYQDTNGRKDSPVETSRHTGDGRGQENTGQTGNDLTLTGEDPSRQSCSKSARGY